MLWQEPVEELLYLLKPADSVVSRANIASVVQHGTVRGVAVASLLRVMSGVFSPLCLADNSYVKYKHIYLHIYMYIYIYIYIYTYIYRYLYTHTYIYIYIYISIYL